MKKLIFILSLLVYWSVSFSQPVVQRSSTAITVQDGNLFAQNSLRPAVFLDTTAANLAYSLDSCGKLIYTYSNDSYWQRACFPSKHWVKILKTGDVANATWGSITGTLSNQTDLQNALNLKLNISDTTSKWLSQSTPLVDTMYRVNDSTVGFNIKHGAIDFAHTFQILGRSAGGGGTVTNVSGTSNRITVTNSSTTPVIDIAATYVGQSSITTLGTITTGTWNGTAIGATFGGTGQTTVTTGDLLYGSASNTWSKLNDVATGNALISGGVTTAPSWGKIGLTTHVSGILPIANGGTGTATPTLVAGTNIIITGSWPNQTINASSSGGTVTQVNTGFGLTGGPITTTGTLKTDTTALKSIYLKRSGINPGSYPVSNVFYDTTGKAIAGDAVRNNLGSFNGVSDTLAFGRPAAHFSSNQQQALTTISNPTLQGGAHDMTWVAWVKLDSLSVLPQTVLSKDDNLTKRGSEYLISYYPPYSGWVWQIEECCHAAPNDGTTWYVISSTGIPVANQWYFIAGQYDHTAGKLRIWVNMVKDSLTGVPNLSNATNTPFTIGSVGSSFDTTGLPQCCSFMNGTIKSVGYWQRVLDSTELATLYNNTAIQLPPPGLNPGTMNGGASFSADVPTVLAAYTNSVLYNGSSGKTAMSSGISFNGGGSSVSVWFKPNTFAGIIFGNSGNANAYIRLVNSTTVRVQTNVGSTFKDYTLPSTLSAGTWYNLIVIRDGSNLTHVYLNGTESGSGGQSQTDLLTIDEIGTYWDGSVPSLQFDGKLSDVRIFNSTLSGTDITNLQTNAALSVTPFLWYKLNEGTGTTNIDYGTAPVPHPYEYSELPKAMKYEKPSSFISWWDLSEPYGTRYDARLRNVIRDSAVTNLWPDISRQNQYIYGSTTTTGSLILSPTTNASPATGATIKMLVNSSAYRAFTAFNSGKVSIGDSIENDNLSVLAPIPSNAVSFGLRRNDGLLLTGLSSDVSANSLLQANAALEIRSGNNNPINLNPANEGVTIGPVRSTPFRLDVLENRTGIIDTTGAGYFAMSGSTYNTTGDSARAFAIWAQADGQRASGSNPLHNTAIIARAFNGQDNIALLIDSGNIKIKNLIIPPSTYNILVHGLTDSLVYQVPLSSIGGTTIYSGDGTLSGNRVVTGSNHNLTFNGVFNYRINANSFILDQATTGFPYSMSIISSNPHELLLGYTPTPTVYSKGYGLYIDTNNNAGLAINVPTTVPLYSNGNSAYVQGFQSGGGNFYKIRAITADYTVVLTDNFITIDATSGNITLTLPAASTAFGGNVGIDYIFKRIDNSGNTVTVQRATSPGTDTIDGAASFVLATQYESKNIRATSSSTWNLY